MKSGGDIGGIITVYVRGGTYYLDSMLEFKAEDSGDENLSIIYRGFPGEETVLSGAHRTPR